MTKVEARAAGLIKWRRTSRRIVATNPGLATRGSWIVATNAGVGARGTRIVATNAGFETRGERIGATNSTFGARDARIVATIRVERPPHPARSDQMTR